MFRKPNAPGRKKVKFSVEVELDPVPGAFHTQESAQAIIQRLLTVNLGFYAPVVRNENEVQD